MRTRKERKEPHALKDRAKNVRETERARQREIAQRIRKESQKVGGAGILIVASHRLRGRGDEVPFERAEDSLCSGRMSTKGKGGERTLEVSFCNGVKNPAFH